MGKKNKEFPERSTTITREGDKLRVRYVTPISFKKFMKATGVEGRMPLLPVPAPGKSSVHGMDYNINDVTDRGEGPEASFLGFVAAGCELINYPAPESIEHVEPSAMPRPRNLPEA